LDEFIRFQQALFRLRWSVKNKWAWASVYPRDSGVTFNLYDEDGKLAGDIDNPPEEWLKKKIA